MGQSITTVAAKEFRTWGYNIVAERMSIVKGLPAAHYTLDKKLSDAEIKILESYKNVQVFETFNRYNESVTSLVIGCPIVIDGELVECANVCKVHDTYDTVCKKKKFTRAAVERIMIDNPMATPKSSVWDLYFEYFTERDLINACLKEEEDNWKDLGAPATFFEYLCSVYEISKLKNGSWLLRVK
jgi:hypothetical protein